MSNLIHRWAHVYRGKTIGEIRRYPKAAKYQTGGKLKKDDLPFYVPSGDDWKAGIPPEMVPRPLFGFDSIKNVNRPVIVCAGQKCQWAWEGLGYQAVTAMGGETAAHLADWSDLAMCHDIWLAPDNDKPGQDWAATVTKILSRTVPGAELKRVSLPNLPDKGDVCDWAKQQPELANWNELDPITDAQEVRERLEEILNFDALKPIPDEWRKEFDWDEPEEFGDNTKAPRLDAEIIPEGIRAFCVDTAERIGCPLEFVALSCITVISATIGAACLVRPKKNDPWKVTPNLWALLAAPASFMKSPGMGAAMAPFSKLDDTAAEVMRNDLLEFEKKKLVFDEKLRKIKESLKDKPTRNHSSVNPEDALELLESPPDPPKSKRHIARDATQEALAKLLAGSPRGLLIFLDELYQLLKGWDNENRGSERPFFLTSWAGDQPYTVDRATKEPLRIPKLCLSLLGAMTPDGLRKYVVEASNSLNDGLIQRFQMMVYLDKGASTGFQYVDRPEDVRARQEYEGIISALASDGFYSCGAMSDESGTPYFAFSDDAQSIYIKWREELHNTVQAEQDPFLEQHWGKYPSLFPSLALIFHLIAVVTKRTPPGPISMQAAIEAGNWCGYLARHARVIYGFSSFSKESEAARILKSKIQKSLIAPRFTVRDIRRKHWRGLITKEEVTAACKELMEFGWLKKVQGDGPVGRGRPADEYAINPKIGFIT